MWRNWRRLPCRAAGPARHPYSAARRGTSLLRLLHDLGLVLGRDIDLGEHLAQVAVTLECGDRVRPGLLMLRGQGLPLRDVRADAQAFHRVLAEANRGINVYRHADAVPIVDEG